MSCEICEALSKCGRKSFCRCCKGKCSISGADIAAITSSAVLSAAIDILFELYFPQNNQSWITKALLSSASSAVATFLSGMIIYSRTCARAADNGDRNLEETCPFYVGLTISQFIAAATVLGTGVGIDVLVQKLFEHPKDFFALKSAIVTPTCIAAARGFFGSVSRQFVNCAKRVINPGEPSFDDIEEATEFSRLINPSAAAANSM